MVCGQILNLHIRIVGVQYNKCPLQSIKQLTQQLTVIWYVETFQEKVKLWERNLGQHVGEEYGGAFYATV